MIQRFLTLSLLLIFISCNKEEDKAAIPAYLHIDQFVIDADFNSEGTSSQKVTTAWIYVNDEMLGAYDLPMDVPIIASGNTKISVEAGMNLNGIAKLRTPYPYYSFYDEQINLTPDKLHYLNAAKDSLPHGDYQNFLKLEIVEDFESPGFGMEATPKSDTDFVKINKAEGAFVFENEPTNSGLIVLKSQSIFEVVSIKKYDFIPVQNYYIELNYKSEIPFTVGVFMTKGTQTIQAPVVQVFPSTTWNKIYINLVTELGASLPDDYKIFIGAINKENSSKEIYIDNVKLVY